MRHSVLTRQTVLALGSLAFGIALWPIAGTAQPVAAITCTNPISGTSWQIKIDYDQKTVDSNPATFTNSEISWRDAANGWKYTLDRKSGNLTVILASATGGNFLYDRCRMEN